MLIPVILEEEHDFIHGDSKIQTDSERVVCEGHIYERVNAVFLTGAKI